jgi:hypothetical protein
MMGFFQRLSAKLKTDRPKKRRRLLVEPLESRQLMATDLASIAGTAFVDLTGNGLTADDTRVTNATIQLYRDNGNGIFDSATDTLLGSTTTNATTGEYRFASTNAGGTLPANTLTAGNYFVRQLTAPGFVAPNAQLATVTATEIAGTTVQAIDNFSTTAQSISVSTATPTVSNSAAATEAIGGERDVSASFTSGTGSLDIQIDNLNSNLFSFASGLDVIGTATLQYDGADNSPALNGTGLGGVNLSSGNSAAGIVIATRGDSPGATVVLRLYSSAANFSTTTVNIPDQALVEEFFVPFSAFTVGGGTGANFTSIGAIEAIINGVIELDARVAIVESVIPGVITSNQQNTAPSIQIVKSTNGQDANTGTGPLLAVGSTATFTYVVTSTGGTSLQSVVVRDDNGTPGNTADDLTPTLTSGDTNSNNILEVTETWTYTATRTVTVGQYSNIGSVTAQDAVGNQVDDTDPSNHFGVSAAINVVKSTNGQDANTTTGPFLGVGSTATFTYVVTNPGNVALATVVLRDDNGTPGNTADDITPTLLSGDTNSNGRLETTETWNYQATRTVTAGQYTNIATVSGNPVDSTGTDIPSITDPTDTDPSNHFGASASINLVKATNGQDANTITGPLLGVGTTATFTYTVTNTGNVPLANLVVRDDNGTTGTTADDFNATFQSGDTNSNGRLDTTETWIYQATRTVTAGQYTNLGTVTGDPVDTAGTRITSLAAVTDTDPSNHLGVTAAINLVKSTNGQDANTTTGPLLAVGSTATFTYVVTNTGTTPLASLVVRDDNGTPGNTADDFNATFQSGDTNSNGRLETTETWTYQATRVVTAGQYTNIGTVTANPVDATGTDIAGLADVSDTDPSNHLGFNTGINLVKSTNGQDANTATGPNIAVGGTATFTYVVTNTGTVPLGSIVVRDDNGTAGNTADDFNATFQSGDTNSNGRLDTTETWNYQATRTVTAGQYTNIGTVTGNPVDSTGADIAGAADVTDTDPSNHFGFIGSIGLQKLTNGTDTGTGAGPNLTVGSTATFTYNVTNTGNVPLTSVSIRDDNGTTSVTTDDLFPTFVSGDTDGDSQLDVTETWVYRATRVVTVGTYNNTATVRGSDPNATEVTSTDVSAHTGIEPISKRRFIASRRA